MPYGETSDPLNPLNTSQISPRYPLNTSGKNASITVVPKNLPHTEKTPASAKRGETKLPTKEQVLGGAKAGNRDFATNTSKILGKLTPQYRAPKFGASLRAVKINVGSSKTLDGSKPKPGKGAPGISRAGYRLNLEKANSGRAPFRSSCTRPRGVCHKCRGNAESVGKQTRVSSETNKVIPKAFRKQKRTYSQAIPASSAHGH